ncbi:hypothetical protein HNR57_005200 [Streptomyces paradoxus]|uniref:Uncharacterized protein n=1 Tax=Streptomyces paradoxus TaxID=66375 RepID=A0A7W9TGH8_9ACTN|nr:hypothetical protein [Streptomyces paradoxus]
MGGACHGTPIAATARYVLAGYRKPIGPVARAFSMCVTLTRRPRACRPAAEFPGAACRESGARPKGADALAHAHFTEFSGSGRALRPPRVPAGRGLALRAALSFPAARKRAPSASRRCRALKARRRSMSRSRASAAVRAGAETSVGSAGGRTGCSRRAAWVSSCCPRSRATVLVPSGWRWVRALARPAARSAVAGCRHGSDPKGQCRVGARRPSAPSGGGPPSTRPFSGFRPYRLELGRLCGVLRPNICGPTPSP